MAFIHGAIAVNEIAVGSGVNTISGNSHLTAVTVAGVFEQIASDLQLIITATGAASSISIQNTGSGGTSIADNGAGGVTIGAAASGLQFTQSGATTLSDANQTGIIIDAQHLGAVLSLNPTGLDTAIGGKLGLKGFNSVGTITIVGAASQSQGFDPSYTSTQPPIVILFPQSDSTAVGSYWATVNGSAGAWSSFTANIHTSGTIAFNYIVIGNNS